MRGIVLSLLGALTLAGPVGCDSDEPPRSARTAVCEGSCTLAVRCIPGVNHSACTSDCFSARPQYDELTTAAGEHYGDCLSQLSCDNRENDEAYDACWQTMKSSVMANADTRTFCTEYTLALFDCGDSYSVERCEVDYAPFTRKGLKPTRSCMTQPSCEQFFACLEAR